MQLPHTSLGILTRPKGSAIYSHGKTTVLAAMYGPMETKPSKVLIDRALIEMHFRPKIGLPGVHERLYEQIVKNICDSALMTIMFPRGTIVIVVQELQNAGSMISSAINAICLALMNCGIDMKFMFAAVTCSVCDNGELLIEPCKLKQDKAKATFVFVFDSVEGMVLASYTTGSFSFEMYEEALKLCHAHSANIFDYYREVLADFLKDLSDSSDSDSNSGSDHSENDNAAHVEK